MAGEILISISACRTFPKERHVGFPLLLLRVLMPLSGGVATLHLCGEGVGSIIELISPILARVLGWLKILELSVFYSSNLFRFLLLLAFRRPCLP